MKAKKKKARRIPFTDRDARVFQAFFDMRNGLYGDEARDYVNRYKVTDGVK